MSAKESILDFIGFVLIIGLVIFAILVFTNPEYFSAFQELMRAAVPLSFFGIIFLIKFKMSRNEVRAKKEEDNSDLVLYLTYMDKMYGELLIFLLPIIIIVIAIIGQGFNLTDFFQASVTFLAMYLWLKSLFKKNR